MRLLLQRETFDGMFQEALPLFQQHKDELAEHKDIKLDINVTEYRAADHLSLIRIFTARIDIGVAEKPLIGYAVFRFGPNPHYQGSIQANADVVFIEPSQRKGRVGLELIRYSERELRNDGAQVVYHHVKASHPTLGMLLVKESYELIEYGYAKRLY